MKMTRKKKEKLIIIVSLISVFLALAGIVMFIYIVSAKNASLKSPSMATAAANLPAHTSDSAQETVASLAPDNLSPIPSLVPYFEKNPDTIGYIKVPNTNIDYPVMYSGDNNYYLNHNFDRDISPEGAIFLDLRCNVRDFAKTRNMIVYGHRMKDGSMFKTLVNYEKKSFFYDNPTIQFDTLYGNYEWEVFTVFETHTDFYYIDTDFPTDEKWMAFMKKCQGLSIYETDTKFYPTDIVLTLSTCAIKQDKRLVVMAKLIR